MLHVHVHTQNLRAIHVLVGTEGGGTIHYMYVLVGIKGMYYSLHAGANNVLASV